VRLRGAFALLVALSGVAGAQRPPAGGGAGGAASDQRAQLEARFRRQFAQVVRVRVGLTDDQMARLAPVNERYSVQRRQLQTDERATRIALQRALRAGTSDTAQVATLLQRLIDQQKRRVSLLEAEQRDLAAIMTPMQRARYMALQEQLRRQVEQRRGGGGQGQGRRRQPPQ
jgi:Spy/CpxP family protein refolding chaperone